MDVFEPFGTAEQELRPQPVCSAYGCWNLARFCAEGAEAAGPTHCKRHTARVGFVELVNPGRVLCAVNGCRSWATTLGLARRTVKFCRTHSRLF